MRLVQRTKKQRAESRRSTTHVGAKTSDGRRRSLGGSEGREVGGAAELLLPLGDGAAKGAPGRGGETIQGGSERRRHEHLGVASGEEARAVHAGLGEHAHGRFDGS